ncbi:glycosyltransferase [Salisediminibacterium halotolerans]|uniref:glycosyltransferase n=1 Tax=Salisediminibacterium halotolerans TaxID=517425 RepID=UPI000EAF1F26|nr:glycosyltransferase [Salisediminibacterium halotolerans]RLJ75699.1 glycosyltransferase involved in cell wall biosynthesis [Actinophytocola xinjiangensis]RPE89553.1 glycosyltransferase involved in cell wall biosynthesis [Salisediminibacterium halotolerans]TWG36312.1 glycosyltransferase involved in cell wall biosynthesis [Salisediminibacterium halotolerans]GEL07240.1 mannosyltransferase [Salisediminibacterium halotolerans]
MKIIVFDVPAERGGALTILKQYYDKAVEDHDHEWVFVVSTPRFDETENVKVLNYPWVKKSWFHRLYFDRFVAPEIVKKNRADEIISLQNITISNGYAAKQSLYLHQSLPFAEKRYSFFENKNLWIYQNVIGRMIFKSIRKADEVIVQTNWMKEACVSKLDIDPSKISVIKPELKNTAKKTYSKPAKGQNVFFYPADSMEYKNHKIIVDAVKKLSDRQMENVRVVFTLNGDEGKNIKRIYSDVQKNKLPIEFIGRLNSEEVFDYYTKAVLVFPSFIETFGLPLLEARMHNTPILVADCPYSREVLAGYKHVRYFDAFDSHTLFHSMRKWIS